MTPEPSPCSVGELGWLRIHLLQPVTAKETAEELHVRIRYRIFRRLHRHKDFYHARSHLLHNRREASAIFHVPDQRVIVFTNLQWRFPCFTTIIRCRAQG